MASSPVYGTRQTGGPGAVDRGLVPPRRLLARSGNRGVSVLRETGQTSMTHSRAPSATHGIADAFYECAQTISATPTKSSMFKKTVASADGANVKSRSAKC
jgi:hypothetical protein